MFPSISSFFRKIFPTKKESTPAKSIFSEVEILEDDWDKLSFTPIEDSHPDRKLDYEIDMARDILPSVNDLNKFKLECYSPWGIADTSHQIRLMENGVDCIRKALSFTRVAGVDYQKLMALTRAYVMEEQDGDLKAIWWPKNTFDRFFTMEEMSLVAVLVELSINGTSLEIKYFGCRKSLKDFEEEVLKIWLDEGSIGPQPFVVNWMFRTEHGMGKLKQPLVAPPQIKGAYPWINGSIQEFADRYMNSNANILLLQGPRGTGKTTFLKQLIKACKVPARITYDGDLIASDGLFIDFIRDRNPGVLIVEDNDELLKARSEGNKAMTRLLNVGDGIISLQGKKMVFTTNLESLDSVDSALLRPGRCFDVIEFRNLTAEEAKVVTDDLYVGDVVLPADTGEGYSLAYLTNCISNEKKPRKPELEIEADSKETSFKNYDLDD